MSKSTPKPPSTELPKAADVLRQVHVLGSGKSHILYSQRFSKESMDAEQQWEHLKGIKDHYGHKRIWSYFIMGVMAFMIIFQSFILCMVGSKVWSFTDYKWLLPALLVQNLAQIIGLAVIVVKSLFKDMSKT
jgi:hypothetical protein